MSKSQGVSRQALQLDTNQQNVVLYAYPEKVFDDTTHLAAQICRTPIALLGLSDGARHWFKLPLGLEIPELDQDSPFWNFSLQSDLLLVEDTQQSIGFADHPLVTGSPYIRFYAAVPLLASNGHPLGILGVMDFKPRQLSLEDIEAIKGLARLVVAQLDLHPGITLSTCDQQPCLELADERERFFKLSLDMLAIAGFDGYYKHLNASWQTTLGYTQEELLNTPYIEFVHPEDRDRTLREAQKLTRGVDTIFFENRYRCKDGSYRWLLWKATTLREQKLIYAVARDITERKQSEVALHESEERYRSVIEAMEEGIVLQDANGTIQACNRGAEQILGLNATQILGRNSLDSQWRTIHADGSPFPGETHPVMISLRTGKPCSNVLMGVHKPDGTVTWINVNSQPLFSAGETKPYAAVGTFTDITDRKQAEERLRLLESVVVNANDAILITEAEPVKDPLGPKIVYVNNAFTRMTGYQFEEVIGKTPRILQGPKSNQTELNKIRQAIAERQPIRAELLNYRKDGSEFWVDLNIVPLADSSGWFTHMLAVQRDITERKQVEYEVRAHARAAAAVAELGQRALSSTSLDLLMQEAVTLVAQTLEVELCKVLELMPGGSALFVRSGVGWQPGIVGNAKVSAYERSQAGYTLLTGEPVIVEDLRIETRFSGTPLLHNHRVVSGATVIIHGLDKPFGILGAHTPRLRKFTEDDIYFMQAVANVLATVIERSSAEAALRESEDRYALAVRGSNEGLWDWNLKGGSIYFSPRWKSMLGCQENEIDDNPDEWFNRVHPEDLHRVRSAITFHLDGLTSHFEIEYRMLHKDQSYRWILCRGLAVRDDQGEAYRMAGSQTDITDRKLAETQLIHDAFHDHLTGLPNRALFMDRLSQAMSRQRRYSAEQFAVLFLDLDRFKIVNDSLGHVVGDRLLIAIAHRLEACLHDTDTIARLGGDEFVILLEDIKNVTDATQVADRIQRELLTSFNLDGHEVCITASIGITLGGDEYQRSGSNSQQGCPYPGDLLRDADIALYRAKELGKARYEVFNTAMLTHAVARLQLENDMRRALEAIGMSIGIHKVAPAEPTGRWGQPPETQRARQESKSSSVSGSSPHPDFILHYQPIISLSTAQIVGFEALVRLSHPEQGLVAPTEFIPVAEETGLIIPMGAWVLREACQQLRLWQLEFPANPPLTMSVNLSSRQFSQPDLTERIEQTLQETHLEGHSLKLEITESVVMENAKSAATMLQRLRALDIQLSIDDFGTGYSSLSYLHCFPINTLKVDRSFVSQLSGEDPELSLQIVRTIVTLAHQLGMDVIAEGIETPDQLEQLRTLQCGYGQGYFFSRPLDSLSAGALIAANQKW